MAAIDDMGSAGFSRWLGGQAIGTGSVFLGVGGPAGYTGPKFWTSRASPSATGTTTNPRFNLEPFDELDAGFPSSAGREHASELSKPTGRTLQMHERINQRWEALLDAELDAGIANRKVGTMIEMPGQNPTTGLGLRREFQVRADPSKPIWFQVKHEFSGISGAPGNKRVDVRYHSANPNAPAGSYSNLFPTTQVNSKNPVKYLLPDGTWKSLNAMTPAEKAAAHFP
jgi:hypothetical protein